MTLEDCSIEKPHQNRAGSREDILEQNNKVK